MRWLLPFVCLTCGVALPHSEETEPPPVPAPDDLVIPVMMRAELARQHPDFESKQLTTGIPINVSTNAAPPKSLRTNGYYLGLAHVNPLLLNRPVDIKVEPGQPFATFGLPSGLARLDLELDGKLYQLSFAEEQLDPKLKLRHVTMSVLNAEGAYARFSVDPAKAAVYGTLRTPEATYVFDPDGEEPGSQAIYRYGASKNVSALDDANRGLIGTSPLAKRHHQIEALADIQPSDVSISLNSAFINGGNLGSVNEISVNSFKRVVARLSVLTGLTGNEQFKLEEKKLMIGDGTAAIFRQVIDGIALAQSNHMTVDKNGSILNLSTFSLPAEVQRSRVLINPQSAIEHTQIEWEAKYNKKAPRIVLQTPLDLQYKLTSEDILEPYYEFKFSVEGDPSNWYFSQVNATSGKTKVSRIFSD